MFVCCHGQGQIVVVVEQIEVLQPGVLFEAAATPGFAPHSIRLRHSGCLGPPDSPQRARGSSPSRLCYFL